MTKTTAKLADKLNHLPELPGIYKMLDSRGNIIYIGKSKSLKKRVKSYFTSHPKWDKVNKMVSFIEDIEITVTDTHLEARFLECELIKAVKPVFNSQMKQDKGYVYLKVEDNHRHNPLSVADDRAENTYGPFRSKFKLTELIATMKNIYPLQSCGNHFEFEYHLLPVKLDKVTYQDNRDNLIALLSEGSKIADFISTADGKMKEAASLYQFESASRYRDLIIGLTIVMHGINGYSDLSTKNILLNIPVRNGCKLFFISHGFIQHKKLYEVPSGQELEHFIQEGLDQSALANHDLDEKSAIDFRDIIYSEIMSLPEDMVIILPD